MCPFPFPVPGTMFTTEQVFNNVHGMNKKEDRKLLSFESGTVLCIYIYII